MENLVIEPNRLEGRILSQPSKSMAHRAILCALLAEGQSLIDNVVLSRDIEATILAGQALGAKITVSPSHLYQGRKQVLVLSEGMIKPVQDVIDCHESGSTARFIMPITRLSEEPVTITGSGRLVSRPFDLYKKLFAEKGINYKDEEGRMPICLEGKLKPGHYELQGDISSQFISGLLFALPLLEGDSTITITNEVESLPYIQMTLASLNDFGVIIDYSPDYKAYRIQGNQVYKACNRIVEGDWSQAAFFCILGAISGQVEITGLCNDSLQGDKVILDMVRRMGAQIHTKGESLIIQRGSLKSIEVDVAQCPDLVPALSVGLALCDGQSVIKNAARLRIKESDRLKAVCEELNKLGARIEEMPDGLIIQGIKAFRGGRVKGWNDHRIVMALAIASSVCNGSVEIEGYEAVTKSYPEFWDDFLSLGGIIR